MLDYTKLKKKITKLKVRIGGVSFSQVHLDYRKNE